MSLRLISLACFGLAILGPRHGLATDVIAPGQEPLLAEMMAAGVELPGACTFSEGQVEAALVRSTFECAAGIVVIELRHASAAGDAAVTTDRFAIAVTSGSPPGGLLDALAARVREREGGFIWISAPAGGPSPVRVLAIDSRLIQAAWALLILASPVLCWRGGRAVGVTGPRALMAVAIPVMLAVAVTWGRPDEPLHANGHAWREAREVLMPWGERSTGGQPFLHGQGGIALQWLLAAFERQVNGAANPFAISRWAGAAAAGATAFLAMILVRSWWAGLAAGCVLALLPLARVLALSGSALAIPAWVLPWSLALCLAAGRCGDRVLLAGAALGAALGTISHTAMLAWPAALVLAWLVAARRRMAPAVLAALFLLILALAVQLSTVAELVVSRNQGAGGGLLGDAWRGITQRSLMMDAQWVSPLLLPLALLWPLCGWRRRSPAVVLASVAALIVGAVPFFAVNQCSSDAVRYQGGLLGLVVAMAVSGIWSLPLVAQLGAIALTILRAALLAALVIPPTASQQPPLDPVAIEHRLVVDATARMEPNTLIILPARRFERDRIIVDFPDFLLPEGSRVLFAGDPRIRDHRGPALTYLGLACISWDSSRESELPEMRPECRELRAQARPWAVAELRRDDLPRSPSGEVWTFHRLATGVPFGFFVSSDPTGPPHEISTADFADDGGTTNLRDAQRSSARIEAS